MSKGREASSWDEGFWSRIAGRETAGAEKKDL
jgi:hypothetical protein